MKFPAAVYNTIHLSEETEQNIINTFQRSELPKGYLLYRNGDICRKIFFIEKGIARIYYTSGQGKEITAWFSAENTFLTAIDSFSCNIPTHENCELLEPSVVFSIDYSTLVYNLKNNPEMAVAAFYLALEIMKKITEYVTSIKFQSAKERFEMLMNNYPSIFLRVPLGYIASYLGITQQTLSRMRARR
jgi:CRP-like cAMP-binding protein